MLSNCRNFQNNSRDILAWKDETIVVPENALYIITLPWFMFRVENRGILLLFSLQRQFIFLWGRGNAPWKGFFSFWKWPTSSKTSYISYFSSFVSQNFDRVPFLFDVPWGACYCKSYSWLAFVVCITLNIDHQRKKIASTKNFLLTRHLTVIWSKLATVGAANTWIF